MAEFGQFAGADHVHVQQWSGSRIPSTMVPFIASQQASIGAYGGSHANWADPLSRYSGEDLDIARSNSVDAGWETASNYSFLDGHAETMRFSEVYENEESNLFDPRLYR